MWNDAFLTGTDYYYITNMLGWNIKSEFCRERDDRKVNKTLEHSMKVHHVMIY